MARFEVTYHPLVTQVDIPKLSLDTQVRIRRAIIQKLTTNPDVFGKHLRKSLKSCRALRVGDYRVVFTLSGRLVRVAAILHRSSGYKSVRARLPR